MLSNLTVGARLKLGFGALVLLMLAITAFSAWELDTLNDEVDSLASDRVPKLQIAYRWSMAVLQTSRHMRNVFILETKEELRQEVAGIRDMKRERKGDLDELSKLVATPEEKTALERVVEIRAAYVIDEDLFLKIVDDGDLPRAKRLMLEQARPAQLAYIDAIQKLIDVEAATVKRQAKGAETYRRSMVMLGGSVAVLLLVAGLASFALANGLSRELAATIQHMQGSSASLQTVATQQSTGAREQASAASEVSTTLQELVATARQIGESAQRVAQLAEDSRAAAKGGDATGNRAQEAVAATKKQVDLIVHHMLDLGKKSQQIGSVLDIINELSEQTNILSINATIEASGAGEFGARFSAVAEEIRRLAERTAGSTKEIRTLIEEIRAGVNTTVMVTEGGSKAAAAAALQITEVAVAFGRIAEAVVVTTQAAQEIELSTRQQTSAVEQLNIAVAGVAQAARDSEVSTSQTLQTASQLTTLARDLTKLVRSDATHA